ncbi:MAG: CPBP family intramembrane glutamic endopeptidase [Ilumatobacteraceae bacterium]
MPWSKMPLTRAPRGKSAIDVLTAALVWLSTWLAGNFIGAIILGASGHSGPGPQPPWTTVVGAVSLWVPMLAGLWYISHRLGVGSLAHDFDLRWEPIDLVGIPIGVLSQLVLLRLIYWPLENWWPATFGREHVERTARDLYDRAHGNWLVILVLVVVVGAPLVEELMYRGLLQGAFTRRLSEPVGVIVVAAWFAIIHFRAVEYPGLFAFGLVLGVCAWRTGRLGMGIMAHMAFNATGLILVAGR